MKENITRNIARCSKCGEPYEKYRGVSDSRCESCADDWDFKKEEEHEPVVPELQP